MSQLKKRSRILVEEDMDGYKDYGEKMGSGLATEKILYVILEAILDIREMLEELVDNGIKNK